MSYFISGIQQMGIGVPQVYPAFNWYKEVFGMDVPVFDDTATAELMLPYTQGEPRDRHAILALNIQGGGGFEIWQHTGRTPLAPKRPMQLGELGIAITKIKAVNIEEAHAHISSLPVVQNCTGLLKDPAANPHFYVQDHLNNWFDVVPGKAWFKKRLKKPTGGTYGATIGVSDIQKALTVYRDVLHYDEVVYDETGIFEDLSALPGGGEKYRRVLLRHSAPRKGSFSELFGNSEIELVQCIERTPKKLFEGRMWGDIGFIHLCYDVKHMDELKAHCESVGHPFTVDSAASFDMGKAAGRFAYIEDPDGTLIEFVETHKMPVVKQLGIHLNVQKRAVDKPLPRWILRALELNKK